MNDTKLLRVRLRRVVYERLDVVVEVPASFEEHRDAPWIEQLYEEQPFTCWEPDDEENPAEMDVHDVRPMRGADLVVPPRVELAWDPEAEAFIEPRRTR